MFTKVEKVFKHKKDTVNPLVSDHPWGTTKWLLTGGGRL